jgi:hypothetical protein
MLRSRFSALLMSLAVLAGTLALTAWVGTTTVLNPDRVVGVAGAVLQSPQGRDALTRELTDRVVAAVPGTDRDAVEAASRKVVSDPRTSGAFESLTGAQSPRQRDEAANTLIDGLAAVNPRVASDARARLRSSGGIDALAADRADTSVAAVERNGPVLGPLAALVPASVNEKLDQARSIALSVQELGAVAAALLAASALLLGPRRDRLLRRLGLWGIVVGGVATLVWIVIPNWVLPMWDSLWSPVAAEALKASGGRLTVMFGMIFAGGLVTLILGFALGQLRPIGRDEGTEGSYGDRGQQRSRARLGYRGEFPEDQRATPRQRSDTWSGRDGYRR